jgi:predicted RNA-binding Zn-ribbon protein involved in translation (DUF1610 family)
MEDAEVKDYEHKWETSAVRHITDDCENDAMECPDCGEIEYREIGRVTVELGLRTEEIIEFECAQCGSYGTWG